MARGGGASSVAAARTPRGRLAAYDPGRAPTGSSRPVAAAPRAAAPAAAAASPPLRSRAGGTAAMGRSVAAPFGRAAHASRGTGTGGGRSFWPCGDNAGYCGGGGGPPCTAKQHSSPAVRERNSTAPSEARRALAAAPPQYQRSTEAPPRAASQQRRRTRRPPPCTSTCEVRSRAADAAVTRSARVRRAAVLGVPASARAASRRLRAQRARVVVVEQQPCDAARLCDGGVSLGRRRALSLRRTLAAHRR